MFSLSLRQAKCNDSFLRKNNDLKTLKQWLQMLSLSLSQAKCNGFFLLKNNDFKDFKAMTLKAKFEFK